MQSIDYSNFATLFTKDTVSKSLLIITNQIYAEVEFLTVHTSTVWWVDSVRKN